MVPTGVSITAPVEYRNPWPGFRYGCSPTTPSPRVSFTLPFASVMIQWRVSRRAGTWPSLRMVMVYEKTKRLSRGSDCSSTWAVSTSTRILGFDGSDVMACIALLQAHRQHVAVRGVQDRVLRKIHQDGETVTLT